MEHYSSEREFVRLREEHELQKKELLETKKILEELKTEYNLKSRECQEAWKSLKELQNELMRKSMHVGSLGEAVIFIACHVHLKSYISIRQRILFANFPFCSFRD